MKGYAPRLALKKRYKTTCKWPWLLKSEKNTALFQHLKEISSIFLVLTTKPKKSGLGSFDLKLYRLVKISGKTENYSMSTSDSGIELDSEEVIISKPMTTRSGRQVKVCTRFAKKGK